MKVIDAVGTGCYTGIEEDADEYYSVEDEDGVLRCSCGRGLVKMDENTWKCPGGFPIYRFDAGEIMLDKWGNMMFKVKAHPNEKDEEGVV